MSDYDVDFDDFAAFSPETPVKGPNLWLVQIAQNPTDQGTPTSGITAKIPPSFFGIFKKKGQLLGSGKRELVDDWQDLYSAWGRKTTTSTEEQTCRRRGDAQGASQSRIPESRRWSQVIQGYVETTLHQRSSEYFPLEFFIDSPTKKNKYWDGQVDRQVHSVPQRLRDARMDTLPVSAMSQEQR